MSVLLYINLETKVGGFGRWYLKDSTMAEFMPEIERLLKKGLAREIWHGLMKDRIVLIASEIDSEMADVVVQQMQTLEEEDPDKDIYLYLNTRGGEAGPGLSIYDKMQQIKPDVSTCCVGLACTSAAVLLAAGAQGKRSAVRNARIMINRGAATFEGTPTEIEGQAKSVLDIKNRTIDILAENSGRERSLIASDLISDYWMSPEEAVKYGILDFICPPGEPSFHLDEQSAGNLLSRLKQLWKGL